MSKLPKITGITSLIVVIIACGVFAFVVCFGVVYKIRYQEVQPIEEEELIGGGIMPIIKEAEKEKLSKIIEKMNKEPISWQEYEEYIELVNKAIKGGVTLHDVTSENLIEKLNSKIK